MIVQSVGDLRKEGRQEVEREKERRGLNPSLRGRRRRKAQARLDRKRKRDIRINIKMWKSYRIESQHKEK